MLIKQANVAILKFRNNNNNNNRLYLKWVKQIQQNINIAGFHFGPLNVVVMGRGFDPLLGYSPLPCHEGLLPPNQHF
jgi:hypothetical protein